MSKLFSVLFVLFCFTGCMVGTTDVVDLGKTKQSASGSDLVNLPSGPIPACPDYPNCPTKPTTDCENGQAKKKGELLPGIKGDDKNDPCLCINNKWVCYDGQTQSSTSNTGDSVKFPTGPIPACPNFPHCEEPKEPSTCTPGASGRKGDVIPGTKGDDKDDTCICNSKNEWVCSKSK